MGDRVRIQHNKRLFVQGCILAALGVAGPALIMEEMLGIYDDLTAAMLSERGSDLILAAIKLVVMNVIRMIPHYLGAFLINESVHIYYHGKKRFTLNTVFTMFLIILIYDMIYWLYGIRYDLGVPAILTVAFVLMLSYMDLFSVNMLNKLILVGSLLMAIQWLDVIPPLSEYGFGRGEISMDVKMASRFIREEKLLTMFAFSMCIAFFYASMIQVQLLYKEHKLKISNEKTRQVEKELYDTQIEALKMRNSSEVQSLVHDLKSPLTTAEGLISLAEMMEEDELLREYFQKISSSLRSMGLMISEILYENKKAPMEVGDLMHMVLAQVSIFVPNEALKYINTCPEAVIRGNKIRLSRAVVNLITNAWNAVDKGTGRLEVSVEKKGEDIYITVLDNGSGMSPEEMEHMWELGYSGRQSTGLGLAFTRQVVENHGGSIRIVSEKGKYTRAMIGLKEERDGDEDGKQKDDSGD